MTSDVKAMTRSGEAAALLAVMALTALGCSIPLAQAAEGGYPFEGTWVRANRACTANAPLARTFTAREVTSQNTHCSVRKIAAGSGQFEIFEECRRAERPGNFTETIRMLGPDAMVVRRQAARLKIPRPLRYLRCTIAAPAAAKPPPTPHHSSTSGEVSAHAPDDHDPVAKPDETPAKP